MSETKRKRGVNDEAAPRCPPHLWLCFRCGLKVEGTEGGAPGVAAGHEMIKEDGGHRSNAAAAASVCCLPHPKTARYQDGATGENAGGSACRATAANIDGAPLVLPALGTAANIAGTSERKLILILDLDQTLLDSTTGLNHLSLTEQFNALPPDNLRNDVLRLDFGNIGMLIKLRPFVRGFLQQASSMFEMRVYTLGNQVYAKAAILLLDPNGVYFGGRVVSRDELIQGGSTKSLHAVPGADPVAAVILDALDDDTGVAWPGQHQSNVILTDRYRYFASTIGKSRHDMPSLAEHGGSLRVALGVLKRVHQAFFAGPRADVREVIAELRGQALRGCTVAFSYLQETMEKSPEGTLMWTLARRLGAECKKDVDETVTHVVAEGRRGTQKTWWAQDNGKFLVTPQWIMAASFRLCRPDEQRWLVWGD